MMSSRACRKATWLSCSITIFLPDRWNVKSNSSKVLRQRTRPVEACLPLRVLHEYGLRSTEAFGEAESSSPPGPGRVPATTVGLAGSRRIRMLA